MPSNNLPVLGICRYNGVDFPSNVETREFKATPVYSSDGRTVTHSQFSLTLHCTFADPISTDSGMGYTIAQLTKPGGVLYYTGRGLSDVRINAGGDQDVNWGPKPRLLSCVPTGAGRSVDVTWQVEWCVPTCGDRVTMNFPMEFTYKLVFAISRTGFTTRTMTGKIVIPQTRLSVEARVPYTSADSWRERVAPALIPGFRRIPATFEVSEDLRTLSFTIIDEELPAQLPPAGVVEAEASHNYTSEPGKISAKWTGVLAAKYRIARGFDTSTAVKAFFAMAKDRMTGKSLGSATGELKAILPWQLAIGDDTIYGELQTTSFRLTYTCVGKLQDILNAGGLWKPLPPEASASSAVWQSSMVAAGVFGVRGRANLAFTPGIDGSIVDLCKAIQPQPPTITTELTTRPPLIPQAGEDAVLESLRRTFPPPPADKSWLSYDCAVTIESDGGIVEAKTLPPAPLTTSSGGSFKAAMDALEKKFPSNDGKGSSSLSPAPGQGTGIQKRNSDTLYVRLTGRAARALFQVPVPSLVEINGVAPTLLSRVDAGEGFSQACIGNALYPIYAAQWSLRYVINNAAALNGALPVPYNPFYQG